MRDFIYIEDCVEGVVKTMDKINNASALNLSTGILTSFTDFIIQGSSLLDKKIEVIAESTKPEGVFARGGDIKKQNEYGFNFSTDFVEGIKKGLNYFEKLV